MELSVLRVCVYVCVCTVSCVMVSHVGEWKKEYNIIPIWIQQTYRANQKKKWNQQQNNIHQTYYKQFECEWGAYWDLMVLFSVTGYSISMIRFTRIVLSGICFSFSLFIGMDAFFFVLLLLWSISLAAGFYVYVCFCDFMENICVVLYTHTHTHKHIVMHSRFKPKWTTLNWPE